MLNTQSNGLKNNGAPVSMIEMQAQMAAVMAAVNAIASNMQAVQPATVPQVVTPVAIVEPVKTKGKAKSAVVGTTASTPLAQSAPIRTQSQGFDRFLAPRAAKTATPKNPGVTADINGRTVSLEIFQTDSGVKMVSLRGLGKTKCFSMAGLACIANADFQALALEFVTAFGASFPVESASE